MSVPVTNDTNRIPWHHQSIQDVMVSFGTSELGLAKHVIEERVEEYGLNRLPKKPPRSSIAIFLSQFSSPLMIILVLAAGASMFLQEWLDVGVIGAAVVINVILGFVEEYKADQSLQKLKMLLPESSKVRRDGEVRLIPSQDIVPGDILLLNTGDKITADARLVHVSSFEANEAALTGESSLVKKQVDSIAIGLQTGDQVNMVFAGTIASSGRAEAVVVATGMQTQIGHISQLVSDVEDEKTPLQRQLTVFANIMGITVLVIGILIFALGVAKGFSVASMFKVAVALAVAAVPEGLIVALTVILAVGMQRILKRHALVRKLVASETLGSVSVICMDKTGTLTTGVMEVDEISINGEFVDISNKHITDSVREAMRFTSAVVMEKNEKGEAIMSGSPTEMAIARYLSEVDDNHEISRTVAEIPFDSRNKFAARIVEKDGKEVLYVLGAPEIVLKRCDLSDSKRSELQKTIESMAARGQRVLMAARRDAVSKDQAFGIDRVIDLAPVGLVGMRDPLRKEAKEAIRIARQAGLHPVMITGDHPQTARIIASEAGLLKESSRVLTGAELDDLSDDDLFAIVENVDVYARVMPMHKLRIIQAWQRKGESVAMTGDGVNDAPAIKAADIGIAFGSGTEVTKETADMVLLKNNFETIVAAIKEGRIIFDNIRKVVVYLVADSFSEVILILGALIFSLPLPILPAQILWINLITDGFPSIALTFEPGEKGIMKESPRKRSEKILNNEMLSIIVIVGLVTDLLLFAVFFYLLHLDFEIERIRTFIFLKLGMDSLFYVFAIRTFRSSIFQTNPFKNKFLIASVGVGFILQFAPIIIPPLRRLFEFTTLSLMEWVSVFLLALLNLFLIEIVKHFFIIRGKKPPKAGVVEQMSATAYN
jgi:P-type Ca2+ transporter type 2C